MTPRTTTFRDAAEAIWGDGGAYAVDTFDRLNRDLFASALPPLPIAIGITAYGHCTGLTRYRTLPRISLASNIFGSTRKVDDTLTHEMLHAQLMLAGLDPEHNARPWCERITALSPKVLGHPVTAAPVKQRRVKAADDQPSRVRYVPEPGHLTRAQLAGWPWSMRPADYDVGATGFDVDTY